MKPALSSALVTGLLLLLALPARAQVLPITTDSEEAREHFERGRLAAFHYRFSRAVAQLDSAIAADPEFGLVHIYRGGSTPRADRDRRGRHFDRAVELGDRMTEGERRMVEAFRTFLWYGDHEGAAQIFHELSLEYPDDPIIPAHLALRYLHALDRYDDAVVWFKETVSRDPTFAPGHNWLGYALLRAGRSEEAEQVLQESLRRHHDDPYTHDFIGEIYLEQGRYDEAARLFERALGLDPSFHYSRANLVRVHTEPAKARLAEALARGDAAAIAAAYTGHGALLPHGGGAIAGAEGIRRFWEEQIEAGLTGAELETWEVYPGGDGSVATEVGGYRLIAGDRDVDEGKYVAVWQRTPEGWRVHRHIWTSDRPARE